MLKVVYIAYAGSDLDRTLAVLHAADLKPVTVDEANPDDALVYASGSTLRIRVAVPESQVERAVEVLRANAQTSSVSTRRLARRVQRGALLVGLGIAALIGIFFLGQEFAPGIPWATITWIGGGMGILLMLLLAQRGSASRED